MATERSAEPGRVRRFELIKVLFAVWSTLVLVFMFVPILLVVRHSFNAGTSFAIWAGHSSTKWWGELFDGGSAWSVLAVFVIIPVVALAVRWVLARRGALVAARADGARSRTGAGPR